MCLPPLVPEHLPETKGVKKARNTQERMGEEITCWKCPEFGGKINWKEGLLEQRELNP